MKNLLWIGLGNPGVAYEHTRHNLGINTLREWVAEHAIDPFWREDRIWPAEIAMINYESAKITGFFPTTFMNDSGLAVKKFLEKHQPGNYELLIIHDDMETALGEAKLIASGSARGHNGVRSIHEALGSIDVPRLLIGTDHPAAGTEPKDFVLREFLVGERDKLRLGVAAAKKVLTAQAI